MPVVVAMEISVLQIIWDKAKNRYVNTEEEDVNGEGPVEKKVMAPPKDAEVTQIYPGGQLPATTTGGPSSSAANPFMTTAGSSSSINNRFSQNSFSKIKGTRATHYITIIEAL